MDTETGAPKKKAATKTTKKTTAKKATARSKKPTVSELLAAYQADLAQLKALISGKEAVKKPPQVELNLSETSSWATKYDMPTFPEVKRLLLAGVAGKLHPDEEELAYLVRELSAGQCLLCGKNSHASVAPGTPWESVQLCDCKFMRGRKGREGKAFQQARVPESSPQTRPVLEGWALARSAADGGIAWLRTEMQAGRVQPNQAVYTGLCRCGKEFPIFAGMIARAVQDYNLSVYVESRKCFACAKTAAAWRAANKAESKGAVPQKKKAGTATLREVMPGSFLSDTAGATQQGGAA